MHVTTGCTVTNSSPISRPNWAAAVHLLTSPSTGRMHMVSSHSARALFAFRKRCNHDNNTCKKNFSLLAPTTRGKTHSHAHRSGRQRHTGTAVVMESFAHGGAVTVVVRARLLHPWVCHGDCRHKCLLLNVVSTCTCGCVTATAGTSACCCTWYYYGGKHVRVGIRTAGLSATYSGVCLARLVRFTSAHVSSSVPRRPLALLFPMDTAARRNCTISV